MKTSTISTADNSLVKTAALKDDDRTALFFARELYYGFYDVSQQFIIGDQEITTSTQSLISKGVTKLFEAGFATLHNKDLLYAQINMFHISEKCTKAILVKGSTDITGNDVDRLALTYFILKQSGFSNLKIYSLYLNKDYVRKGNIDLEKLFILKDMTINAKKAQLQIPELIVNLKLKKDKQYDNR
jgi:hypothetical protein